MRSHTARARLLDVCTRYILRLRPARRTAPRPGPEADNSQLFTLHVRVVPCAIQVEGIRIVLLNDFNGRSVPLVSTSLQPVQVLGSGRPSCFVVRTHRFPRNVRVG